MQRHRGRVRAQEGHCRLAGQSRKNPAPGVSKKQHRIPQGFSSGQNRPGTGEIEEHSTRQPDSVKYLIEGRNLELLRVEFESEDDAVVAEVGKMVYMNGGVEWSMAMPGRGISGKLAGESILMTRFARPGEVGFAGDLPGTIRSVELDSSTALIVQRGGFLTATPSVELSIALVKRLRVNVLGGQNLVLQRLTGPGVAFIHASGDFVEFDLAEGERLRADTGSMVGGEGLFLSSFTGPGRVTLQTMGHAVLEASAEGG